MNLRDLKINTKVVEIPFPSHKDFVIKLGYITREASTKIRDESMITKIDPKLRMPNQVLDQDIFVDKFVELAIKGWSGLKYSILSELMLVDLSSIENKDEELEYSHENAVELLKGSQVFDNWINEEIFNLDRFRDK